MKRYYTYFKVVVIALYSVLLTACSDDTLPYGELVADTFQIDVAQEDRHLTFDVDRSASIYLKVKEGVSWYVSSKPDWISMTEYGSGSGNLTVSVIEDNNSDVVRQGVISLTTGRFNNVTEIDVEQTGGYIKAQEVLEFPAMSDSKTFAVESNVSWRFSTNNNSLIETANPKNGSPGITMVTIQSKTNTKATDDIENLTIEPDYSGGVSSVTPWILQLKREKVILETEIINNNTWFTTAGGSFILNIKSNSNWMINNLDSWLKPNAYSGSKNQNITFIVENNTGLSRSCTFCVESGEVQTFIWIGQEGMPIPTEDDNITPQYIQKK